MVVNHHVVIDRPKGSAHPRYPDMIYPLDYGYLDGTTAGDGQGIDVWVGSEGHRDVQVILCMADLMKRDLEIKLMMGCNEAEISAVVQFMEANSVGCVVVRR